jgi:hypothetical protein
MGIGPFLALSALFRGYSNYPSDFGFPALPGYGLVLTAVLRISCVDIPWETTRGSGVVGGLHSRVCRTVLWYHGRSMVVPYCYQCAPYAQPAILTIANAYTARMPGGMQRVQ